MNAQITSYSASFHLLFIEIKRREL